MAGLPTRVCVTGGLVSIKLVWWIPFTGWFRGRVEWFIEWLVDLDFSLQGRDFGWSQIPAVVRGLCTDRGREAYLGRPTPQVRLHFVDRNHCNLRNFLRVGRPLVVNLVSRLDDPVWTALRNMNDLARRMAWMADFLTIVIGCGVAKSKSDFVNVLDTDPVNCMRHHSCVQDRKTLASFLAEAGIAGDLVYDTASNDAERKFGAMPERLFVIYNDTFTYVGERGGRGFKGYDVKGLEMHLRQLAVAIKKAWLEESRSFKGKKISDINTSFRRDDPRNPRNLIHRPGVHLRDESSSSVVSIGGNTSTTSMIWDIPARECIPQRSILKKQVGDPGADESSSLRVPSKHFTHNGS